MRDGSGLVVAGERQGGVARRRLALDHQAGGQLGRPLCDGSTNATVASSMAPCGPSGPGVEISRLALPALPSQVQKRVVLLV